jgi:ribosomal protein S1
MFFKPIMKILNTVDENSPVDYEDVAVRPRQISQWYEIERAYRNQTVIEGILETRTQTGYIVRIGEMTAFMPHYRFDVFQYPHIPAHYQGVRLGFHVIKVDPENQKAQVSHLSVVKERRRTAIQAFNRGEIHTAEVTAILDNGVTLDIKGIPAILHSQDISWETINTPHDRLRVGNVIKVKILKVQAAKLRLVAGLKQLDNSRWQSFIDQYKMGDIVSARVTDFTDYGCFLSCDKGVVGLLHQSEISWSEDTPRAAKYLRKGQALQVKLIAIDSENERLSFSLKQVNPDPWERFVQQHQVGDIITGRVINRADYGVFIDIGQTPNSGLKGLLHNKDISWLIYGQTTSLNFKTGSPLGVRVLNFNKEQKRLSLGLKQLTDNPFEKVQPKLTLGENGLPTISIIASLSADDPVPPELAASLNKIQHANIDKFRLRLIDNHDLESADLIIPLLSPHYLRTDDSQQLYQWLLEKTHHYENNNQLLNSFILPIIIDQVDANHCFSHLASLPPDQQPPSAWVSRSTCWHNIEKGIEGVIQYLVENNNTDLDAAQPPEK